MSLAKPQMRGLFSSYMKKHFLIGFAFTISCGLAWKYLVMEPKKKKYAEFYKYVWRKCFIKISSYKTIIT